MIAYPAYKDSDISWLSTIPEHWDVKPLRAIFKIRNEKNNPVKTHQILSLSIAQGVTLYSDKGRGGNKAKEDLTAYKIAYPNDIVVNSMNVIVGAVGLSKYLGAISPVYYAIYLRSVQNNDINYYATIFSNHKFQRYLSIYGKGILIKKTDSGKLNTIRMKISLEDFKKIVLPLPPIDEQIKIAKYLDWKTTKINKFIKAKKKLIALLKEQKQNIFNKALTRGINPNIKMKDSGINWLGEIPTHWKAIALKNCISPIEQGWSPQCESKRAEENEWGVLKVGCVNGEKFDVLQNKKLPDNLTPKLQYEIKQDDIIVSRANTRELVGLAAIVDKNYSKILLCDKLYRFTTKNHLIIKHFLVLSMRTTSSRIQIEMNATGASSSMQNISQGVIKNLYLPLPPIPEQEQIIKFLDKETFVINKTIKRAEQEIDLIQEYKTRLISDVVTGKIDVRSIQVPEFESIEKDIDFFDENNTEEEVMEDIEE